MTQKDLSLISNVSLGSIKRWEESGEINFKSLIKIARALGVENDLEKLFNGTYYRNIDEVIKANK